MTEQPPSAEAQEIADGQPLAEVLRLSLARDIDTLIADRVSAETVSWQNRDRQRLEQISTLQETVQSLQSAPAERPAPDPLEQARQSGVTERALAAGRAEIDALMDPIFGPVPQRPAPEGGGYVIEVEFDDGVEAQRAYDAIERLLGEMGQLGTLGMRALPSALASTGEQPDEWVLVPRSPTAEMLKAAYDDARANDNPLTALDCWDSMIETAPAPPSAAVVVDYTERARELLRRIGDAHGRETQSRYYEDNKPSVKLVVDALSAVASEHQAAAIRAFGSRVWSDTEEVAYRAGATNERAALLARLQEPDVREAVHIIMYDDKRPLEKVDAALTKIAEMLK